MCLREISTYRVIVACGNEVLVRIVSSDWRVCSGQVFKGVVCGHLVVSVGWVSGDLWLSV